MQDSPENNGLVHANAVYKDQEQTKLAVYERRAYVEKEEDKTCK